jgi:hypothetical protein
MNESEGTQRDSFALELRYPTAPLHCSSSRPYFPLLPGGSLFPRLQASSAHAALIPATTSKQTDVTDFQFDPIELGFIPPRRWTSGEVTLSDVTEQFFKARSSKILRFEQKLWNALALTKHNPGLYSHIGVKWISSSLIKVNRDVFGPFINLTRPAAALYNNQGSFLTHGFVEVPLRDASEVDCEELTDVDESIIRLFKHRTDSFSMKADQTQIMGCRYTRGE